MVSLLYLIGGNLVVTYYTVRFMRSQDRSNDLEQVSAIDELHNEYLALSPVDIADYLKNKNTIGLVAEDGDEIVSFCIYHANPDNLEIMWMGSKEAYSEEQLYPLFTRLTKRLTPQKTSIIFKVRESDTKMFEVLRNFGFKAIGVAKHIFTITGEDGYIFKFQINSEV